MPYDDLRKGRISRPNQVYFVTVATWNRERYFSEFSVGRMAIQEMRRLHEERDLSSFAWVLMPDHLHWLFQLGEKNDLPTVLKKFKGRSTESVNRMLSKKGPVWQKYYYDRAIRKDENIRNIARYMVANPLRKSLVSDIGAYPLWDAVWLQNGLHDV